MDRYSDSRVLVTGATGGLGAEICRRLAAEGARLVVADLPGTDLGAVLGGLPGTGHLPVDLDVSDEDDWRTVVARVEDELGGLEVLVNNAGIGSLKTVEDEEREHWDRVLSVDATGVWLGMKHAGPLIERSGGGAVVNVASILGSTGGLGNSVAYHAAKGAVRTITKNAALHWATRGVRVNSLHPGFIETPQLLERYAGTERHQAMLANTPMGRLGRPEEIAGVVAFLGSADAGYLTGTEVYADGGWTAR
ncbi:SDR family oxidoreductase [Pimelobacter simplex]|uniref:Short-chain dehydrogenase n=1 Tax=Nocardioides simplex TaxID=2045 RepID=A0A0A1DH01_NOCSI|nr:SDR family NAD(P)-dependent oxidoreductase [Pimelobacter simplex]AIY15877.1 short-chain dehydrogenase [Pimelobacter simplex]MCG8154519.1 SDR family oxidoreductase [Pimelobacter simplex]GEB12568.1 oxidoreductase [Pimelobacter simplex]SFM93189.1 NAD(P)-dependent dehydrogenase, short-chain alcohol dehydrogenase family [Pimelobacter simplex]